MISIKKEIKGEKEKLKQKPKKQLIDPKNT